MNQDELNAIKARVEEFHRKPQPQNAMIALIEAAGHIILLGKDIESLLAESSA